MILCDWSSVAEWRCWDGRLFLYIEPILDENFEDTGEFLKLDVWDRLASSLSTKDRQSYSESVIIDWMQRREQLGDTLNPDEDDWVALRDDKLTISEPYKRFEGSTIQKVRFRVIQATEKTNLTILIQPSA